MQEKLVLAELFVSCLWTYTYQHACTHLRFRQRYPLSSLAVKTTVKMRTTPPRIAQAAMMLTVMRSDATYAKYFILQFTFLDMILNVCGHEKLTTIT